MNEFCVITTVNSPTRAIEVLYEKFGDRLIIVGDKKTPKDWNYKGVVPIENVDKLYAPENHYARKNIGYLAAIKNKPDFIYCTDDDNIPNDNWEIRTHQVEANEAIGEGWYNVYKAFSFGYIWARGFSLKHLNKKPEIGGKRFRDSSIQQGLSDYEPDVDAIWRLLYNKGHEFTDNKSIYLNPFTWSSFNSQCTWWFPKAYPLMYLPVYASFRMTDIWRSFVGQRCLWEIGEVVTFHSPSEVFQDRNEHDLLSDFKDEIPGYLHNDEIVEILSALTLKKGDENICENMLTCYQAIVDKNILPEMEIRSLKQWIKDFENITRNMA